MWQLDRLLGDMIFPAPPPSRVPSDVKDDPEFWSPMFEDVGVPAMRLTPGGASASRSILYFHGNAESMTICREYAKLLADRVCADVYVIEYPGYWADDGGLVTKPTERGVYDAAVKAAQYVASKTQLPLSVVGYSLGCCPAARVMRQMGERVSTGALIAPMRSVAEMAASMSGLASMLHGFISRMDVFSTEKDAPHIRCHCMVLHGTADKVIPIEHGNRCVPTPLVQAWSLNIFVHVPDACPVPCPRAASSACYQGANLCMC